MARILVIDDEEEVRKTLAEALHMLGHEVVEAPNGRIGIKLLREEPTDLVITDLFMPEQEGLETIMEIRRDFPHLKVIAISGGSKNWGIDCLSLAERLGAVDRIAKPFSMMELHEVVSKALKEPD